MKPGPPRAHFGLKSASLTNFSSNVQKKKLKQDPIPCLFRHWNHRMTDEIIAVRSGMPIGPFGVGWTSKQPDLSIIKLSLSLPNSLFKSPHHLPSSQTEPSTALFPIFGNCWTVEVELSMDRIRVKTQISRPRPEYPTG